MNESVQRTGELICQLVGLLRITLDKIPEYRDKNFCFFIDAEGSLDVGTTCTPEELALFLEKIADIQETTKEILSSQLVAEVPERTIN